MSSIIEGYNYDIFISYRHKDNKGDRWVSEFVEALKTELEATFKEDVSVYFDENPHDRLRETHNVDKSLEGKLKCLIFIPILSQTYCDPISFAWQNEFLAFIKIAENDRLGIDVRLKSGNVASRILPIRIHDLEPEDVKLFEKETGSVLRAMDFVFKTSAGVNRPLRAKEDHPNENLNKTFYRDQINKAAHAIKEIMLGIKSGAQPAVKEESELKIPAERVMGKSNLARTTIPGRKTWQKILSGILIAVVLILAGLFIYPKLLKDDRLEMIRNKGEASVAVMPFQNLTNDPEKNFWQLMIQDNLINFLSNSQDLKVRQSESVLNVLQNNDLASYASITPLLARQVSRKLDADVFVFGSIKKIDQIIRLNANLVDSETEEVFKSFQLDGKAEEILTLTDSLTVMVRDYLIVTMLKKGIPTISNEKAFGHVSTNSPEAFRYYIEGVNIFGNRDYHNAIELFYRAIEIDPDFLAPKLWLPNSFGNQGLYEEARRWAKIVNENKDNLSRQERMRAEFIYANYFETPDDAIRSLRQMREIDNQSPMVCYLLGSQYAGLGQYEKAISEYERALEIYKKWGIKPAWTPNYTALGAVYQKTGQYKKERKLYKRAERDFPDDHLIIRRQAILELSDGKTKKANEYIDKYQSIRRGNGDSEGVITTNLALMYEEAEIPDMAEKYFREALSMQPELTVRLYNLARFLIDTDRDINEGLQLVDKALNINPDNYNFTDCKGWGLYKQGKYSEALEILQKSWDLRIEKAVYDHKAFLHLEAAKKAVAGQKSN